MHAPTHLTVLVTGATGFVGGALLPALVAAGHTVVAASRRPRASPDAAGVTWRVCDVEQPATLAPALQGIDVAYYLVHSMGEHGADYAARDRAAASAFAEAAASAGVRRLVYLGGPMPAGTPSEHLRSRMEVGEVLRAGRVPVVELRASMIVGDGSASWQIVRDLAMRLPAMVLPRWLRSRTCPVALDDVIVALCRAADVPLAHSEWFDIPGPDTLSGREILQQIAALAGRKIHAVEVPLLTPKLSALWLRLVTSTDFALARELVLGLTDDILPRDARYWELIGHTSRLTFAQAATRAFASEAARPPSTRRLSRVAAAWERALAGHAGKASRA